MAKRQKGILSDGYSHLLTNLHKIKNETVAGLHTVLESIESEHKIVTEALDKKASAVRKHLQDLGVINKPVKVSFTKTKKVSKSKIKPRTKSRTKSTLAKSDSGNKAVAYLKRSPGKWVASAELAGHIGTEKVAAAIAMADDAKSVQKRGPGRKREFMMK